jgi:DNA-binding PadR family transcriptional regulator
MTRLLVLGLLGEQPMSGYDIQQMLGVMNAEKWSGVLVGSIYHALKKLEQEKHIELVGVEQTGYRQKSIYRITEQGNEHLKVLITDALRTSSILYPSTLYSGLSYVDKLPKETVIQALTEQQHLLDEEYDTLEQGLEEKKAAMQDDFSPMIKLIFDNMFDTIKQQQQFVEKALDILKRQDK